MKYSDDLVSAADNLKKAVPHMVKNKIPANPVNYTLWYHYVANDMPSLNKELDETLAESGGLSADRSQELYHYYFITEHLRDHQDTLEGITELTAHLLDHIGQSMDGSESFGKDLTDNIERIKQASTAEDITPILESVISTSENMRAVNDSFQDNMKKATEEINELREQLEQAEKHAYIDQLTQLYNRHAFDQQLGQLLETETVAENVCIILTDLDHFKSFNDDYGHVIGDRVLTTLGKLILDHCPEKAIGARYGGEEFVIIVKDSDTDEAFKIADDLRKKVEQLRVKMKNSDKVLDNITSSFGIARYRPGENAETFIDRADKALYSAKQNGRNRVEIFDDALMEAS